jgi:RNA polymerase sigma factor (sigma-70 family)
LVLIGRLGTPSLSWGLVVACNDSWGLDDWSGVGEVSSGSQPIEAVYRSSWLPLTRLAYLLVGDRNEAEDVVQAVFATAASRWETIGDPSAYLRRAVVNRANDVHRRSFRAAATFVPADRSVDEPDVDEVWGFVQRLPMAQRAVVVLRFYEDLSLGEIASLLGRPASTVRSDLRRALAKLKGSLV